MPSMDIIVSAVDRASDVLENVSDKGSKAAQFLEKNWVKVTVAMAALGAGIEKLTRDQAPLTEQTRRLASSLDMTENEMRDLAIATSNVTFPLGDVLDLMELGRQQGIKSAEQLQEYALFWDMVGDATGQSAKMLAQSGVALRTMGVGIGRETDALNAFGFITQETTMNVGDFLSIIEKVGPDLNDMGMSIDDAAAILGILEREMGLTGTTARRELMQAINQSEGEMSKLFNTLGITTDQFNEYKWMVIDSSDVIGRNSDLHAESYTIMQKFQHGLTELTYKYGSLIQTASNLVPLLVSLGPAMKAVTSAKGLMTIATTAQTAATTALGAAMAFVTSPIFLVVAAITAAVAVGWYLYKNWDQVVAKVQELWLRFLDKFMTSFHETRELVFFIVDTISQTFTNVFASMVAKAMEFKEGFLNAFDLIATGIKAPINAVIGGLNRMIDGLNRISVTIPDWVPVFGGNSFSINIPRIPTLHTGGLFRSPVPGGEGLALLSDRERVYPPGYTPQGDGIDYDKLAEAIVRAMERFARPNVHMETKIEAGKSMSPSDVRREQDRLLRELVFQW